MGILVLLAALAGTVVVLVYSLLTVWYKKKYPSKEYDERQELARGQAAGVSFWVMLIYFLAIFAVYAYRGMVYDAEIRMMEAALAILTGLEFSLLIYHTCCILTHAALPMKQKPRRMMVSYLFIGMVDLLNYYLRCWQYPDSGNCMEGYMYLLIGVGACYLSVLYLIEWLRGREEARDGEE